MFAGKKLQIISIVTLFCFTWFCFAADLSFAQSKDEEPLLKAKGLSHEGDYDGAIKILQDYIEKIRLIKKEKQNLAKAFYSLARTYYKVGEEELCDENLRMVYETYSNFSTEESDLNFKDVVEKIKKEVEDRLRVEKEEKKVKVDEKKVEVKTAKKPVVKEESPKKKPAKKVIEKPAKKKKKKKFPWLLVIGGAVAIGIILFLILKKKTKKYTLTVNIGEGVQGTPASGTYTYKDGEVINYNYYTTSGYSDLNVLLDGHPVPSSGNINMNENHSLTAEKDYVQEVYDSIKWIEIPAGEFKMGDNFDEGSSDEQPVHKVYLNSYKIAKYELTFEQYDKFCDATGRSKPTDYGWGRGTRPVVNVNWDDAKAFCDWLSDKTGKNIHLPTEAQWEKAARGTDQRRYPWGNSSPDCNKARYEPCSDKTAPVGSHPSGVSPYGIHDMAGNVWEWCSDWHSESFYSSSPRNNPTGPASGSSRVLRGGGWRGNAFHIRSANRYYLSPSYGGYHIGFRLSQD